VATHKNPGVILSPGLDTVAGWMAQVVERIKIAVLADVKTTDAPDLGHSMRAQKMEINAIRRLLGVATGVYQVPTYVAPRRINQCGKE